MPLNTEPGLVYTEQLSAAPPLSQNAVLSKVNKGKVVLDQSITDGSETHWGTHLLDSPICKSSSLGNNRGPSTNYREISLQNSTYPLPQSLEPTILYKGSIVWVNIRTSVACSNQLKNKCTANEWFEKSH